MCNESGAPYQPSAVEAGTIKLDESGSCHMLELYKPSVSPTSSHRNKLLTCIDNPWQHLHLPHRYFMSYWIETEVESTLVSVDRGGLATNKNASRMQSGLGGLYADQSRRGLDNSFFNFFV